MHRLVLLCSLLLCVLAPTAQGADVMRTTRLVVGAGLLAEADRAQSLFVRELERRGLPDDDGDLALAVRTMFPASRIRDRWISLLAEQLTESELAAAETFHGSVPGREFSAALRDARRPGAALHDAPAAYVAAAQDMEGPAREAVLRVRIAGAAQWLVAREAGATPRLEDAWQDALDDHRATARDAELRALLALPAIHALGCAEYAASSDGRRFYGKLTAALDVALTELVEEHRGFVRRALERRALAQSPG